MFGIVSCNTEENLIEDQSNQVINYIEKNGPQFHIIYVDFEDFGRTSKQCRGIGLCNATVCTFCCTDGNGNIINCSTNEAHQNAGVVEIHIDTNNGFLYIPLNPIFEEDNVLIEGQPQFFVDESIMVSDDIIVHEGEYTFETKVGSHGGYKIKASRIVE